MPKAEQQGWGALRAEVQRKLAAKIDLGTPDPPPPEVERVVVPKVERPRIETLRAEVQKKSTSKVERRSLMGRWRIRPSRIALLFVALLAGGMAAFLATQHDLASTLPAPQPAAQPAAAAPAEPRMQILVAKQAIGMGQRLSPASVEWEDWPQGAVRPEYITIATAPNAMTDMAGSATRFALFPGEPIRKEQLAPPGSGYLSAILDNGMRGVSVSVAAESASGGFIQPNDHVDVVLTRTSNANQSSATILGNVRVLGINTRLGQGGTGSAPANSGDPGADAFSGQAIATLELSSQQAEVIINATGLGRLSLVLRPAEDSTESAALAERNANAAIRLSSPFWTK